MLFSIGHGVRKAEEMVRLLKLYHIDYLIDVRSIPMSRFNPQFNQKKFAETLKEAGITYVFMGDALGGKPKDPSLYNEKGRPDYAIISQQAFFKAGIERLITGYNKEINAAFMCSETKPLMCHRTHLISPVLLQHGIDVQHIDEKGELILHSDLIKQTGLFV